MGVSLERVQFKFASIVGELCNEPDVLSQFAVWLDLRLAEYKLKGNISLDCSGEEPDPIWLKGLNKGRTNKSRKMSHSGVPGSSPSHSRNSHFSPHYRPAEQTTSHDQSPGYYSSHDVPVSDNTLHRLSPDVVVVVVKEEDDLYPVSLHYNTDAQSGDSRKRLVSDSPSVSIEQRTTPNKQTRFSDRQPDESPSNQSLMSVLNGYQGDTQESDSKGDNSSYILPSTSSMAAPDLNTDSFNIGSSTDTSFNTSQNTDSSWGNPPGNSLNTVNENATLKNWYSSHWDPGDGKSLVESVAVMQCSREDNALRKKRINSERLGQIPRQTVISMVAAVGCFERWLWDTFTLERRPIVDLPPEQLNKYMSHFFKSIRLPNGTDYKPESFRVLKSYLSRYLKEVNYPECLSTSPLFMEARGAYQSRRATLVQQI